MTELLVIGTGLIGTSLGLAATAAGYRVQLADGDPEHVRQAATAGAGSPRTAASPAPTIVVVAVPPSAAAAVIRQALLDHPQATVTDVCSVKAPVLAALAADGADLARVVGGHPMAGRETSGPAAASAELFHGRTWLLTPLPQTDPDRIAQVRALAAATGAAVREMPAELHDKAVALTSHAPQVVSSLMAARLAASDPGTVAVAGQGLRDVVRIAGSDPALWADILCTNAGEVTPVLTSLRDDLAVLLTALDAAAAEEDGAQADAGNAEQARAAVSEVIAAGNRGSAMLPAKHGGEAAAYVELPVEVPDAPGELGRLFLVAGDAGVNLEDVRIEHTVGRLTAIAHLYVLPESLATLREALRGGDWLVLE